MSNKTTNGLYDTLFRTLEGVEKGTVDLEKAKSVVNISNAIVNVAKLELSVVKETKQEFGVGIVPTIGSNSWLSLKNDESIKLVSAPTKDELLTKMSEFCNQNKSKSPDLISNKFNPETQLWEAQYRLANIY